VAIVGQQGCHVLPKAIGQKQRGVVGGQHLHDLMDHALGHGPRAMARVDGQQQLALGVQRDPDPLGHTLQARAMAGVRFTDLQSRPMEFLDFTSVTLNEFQQLVPPFETAFHARMTAWRMDGKPRTARRFTVDKNCPLPTPEDRLLFILVYLKTYALQVVHGRLFGMGQSKANQWIHVLLPVLLAALRALGDAPARSLTALAQRLGVAEADAATVVAPLEEEPVPLAPAPAAPLLPMTGPHGASSAPKTLVNSKRVRAGRKKTTPSKMSCSSMPCSRSSF
jgi:hypothetical protein